MGEQLAFVSRVEAEANKVPSHECSWLSFKRFSILIQQDTNASRALYGVGLVLYVSESIPHGASRGSFATHEERW